MALLITKTMRAKYVKRRLPSGRTRHAPGGEDVLRLCDVADRLEWIILDMQRKMPAEDQNQVERKLWSIGT